MAQAASEPGGGVSKDQFKAATNANAILLEQSVQFTSLSNRFNEVTSRLADLTNQLAGLTSQVEQLNRSEQASESSDKKMMPSRVEAIESSITNVESQSRDVKKDLVALQQAVGQAQDSISDLKKAGLDAQALGVQLAAVSNSLSTNFDLLMKEMQSLRLPPVGLAENRTAANSMPGSLWVLLLANLVMGTGALGVSVVLLRERKSVATQVRSVVAEQIPGMAKTLTDQVQPRLDAAIRQGQDLAATMRQTAELNQKFLDSMKAKHEQNLETFVDSAVSASRTAIETWAAEARSMLGGLQQQAGKDFQKLFQDARNSWQSELGLELQKAMDNWNSLLKESQGHWQKRLEGEIAEIKQTWLRQLDDHQRQWQARLNTFVEAQPEMWQRRLNEAAEKAGAAWHNQLADLEAKNSRLWHSIEEGLADAQSRLTRLNEEIGGAFQLLKVRDDAMTALAWPPFFQDGGALAGWKKRIEDRLAQHDPRAFDLFLALGRFNSASREAEDRRRLAEVLHGVGVEAYRFWKEMGLSELDAALEWRSGFQGYLDSSGIPVDIILALERDRFDANTMLSVDAGLVARMYVKEALSWTVRDKSSDPPKVLCHARVITC
jgi:hypothetical protein